MPVQDEQRTLARMHKLSKDGLSVRGVAEKLDAEGRLQRNGKGWNATQVQRLLKRKQRR